MCSGSHKRHNEQGATQCYQAFLVFTPWRFRSKQCLSLYLCIALLDPNHFLLHLSPSWSYSVVCPCGQNHFRPSFGFSSVPCAMHRDWKLESQLDVFWVSTAGERTRTFSFHAMWSAIVGKSIVSPEAKSEFSKKGKMAMGGPTPICPIPEHLLQKATKKFRQKSSAASFSHFSQKSWKATET